MQGDITGLDVDIIVNAANTGLSGGGGVDGAIHKAGGPAMMDECRIIRETKGGCPTGEAVITTAGNLKARSVIHTVGPVWEGGRRNEMELLANAYFNSLALAAENGAVSVAFPNISTGVYGFPKAEAATIAVKAVRDFLAKNPIPEKVIFCCFDEENFRIYSKVLK